MKSIIVRTKDLKVWRLCFNLWPFLDNTYGHIRYLKHAKAQGGKLITAILPDIDNA